MPPEPPSERTPEPPPDPAIVEEIAQELARVRSVLFITGAGMSADSGLPTYRGIGGLYEDAHTDEGVPIEVALSGAMMRQRPELTWKYLAQIERACRGARFNRGHEVIAAIERRVPRAWVLTQNVDGFHGDAGSRNVIEIHGNNRRLVCTACPHRVEVADLVGIEIPPRCRACGAVLRPDVVLFGEWLPPAALATLDRELARGFDLLFVIGTTAAFPYISGPIEQAAEDGLPTVEINPGTSGVSHLVRYGLKTRAAPALEAIWERLRQLPGWT